MRTNPASRCTRSANTRTEPRISCQIPAARSSQSWQAARSPAWNAAWASALAVACASDSVLSTLNVASKNGTPAPFTSLRARCHSSSYTSAVSGRVSAASFRW